MGFLLGLIAYIGWGAGDIFGVYASRKIGAYKTTAFVYIFGLLIPSFYLPFALSELHLITLPLLVLNIILGIAYLSGNMILNEAFKQSSASLIGVIIPIFPAVVLLLSAFIFKDPLSSKQLLWISIIFIGMFLCTINFDDLKKKQLFKDIGVRYALIAVAIFSVYFTFFRVFADVYGWFWPNYISFMTFPIVLVLAKKLFNIKEKLTLPNRKIFVMTFICALLLRSGDIAFNYGLANNMGALTAPLAGASPTLFIVLSSVIFKDPVTSQQKLGILITIIGIVLLSFFA